MLFPRVGAVSTGALAAALALGAAGAASAATLLATEEGNECAGVGFSDCTAEAGGVVTPTIAKYEYDDGTFQGVQISDNFDDVVDEADFQINLVSDATFTFSYTPGEDGPFLTAIAVFGGGSYNLYGDFGSYAEGTYAPDFTFAAPLNPGGRQAAISHITFFDSAAAPEQPPNSEPEVVPLPAAGLLLLGGLGGLGVIGARRRKG